MKTKRFILALSAVALLAGMTPAQAHDHNGYGRPYYQHQGFYQTYPHYGYYRGYYRPVVPIVQIPLPVIVIHR